MSNACIKMVDITYLCSNIHAFALTNEKDCVFYKKDKDSETCRYAQLIYYHEDECYECTNYLAQKSRNNVED